MISKKLQDALNAQINAEMWSAYLYLSMSVEAESKGLKGFGNWFFIQFREEQDHARILIERHSLQDDSALHLPKTVHLLPRRGQPFEFEGEHRLEQRQFRTPSPTAADTLHHVTLTPQRVGQQVHDHRAVAVLERIEHDSPRLVCLERSRHLTLSLRAPSPSRRAYALRPAPARRPEPEPR